MSSFNLLKGFEDVATVLVREDPALEQRLPARLLVSPVVCLRTDHRVPPHAPGGEIRPGPPWDGLFELETLGRTLRRDHASVG